MPNQITGREVRIGLKKSAAWRTPVECGADDGLLVLSESLKVTRSLELDDSAGQAWTQDADAGPISAAGTLTAYMRYEGLDVALALLCGQAGAPTLVGMSDAYTNSYKLTSNIDGLFATLAMLKLSNKVWEFPSAKIHGFKLSADANKPLKITLDVIADTLNRASAINTAATMANVTIPDKSNRILMNKNAIFRINDQGDPALDAANQINPTKFDLSFKRPMAADGVAGSEGVDEPSDNGFPTCSLSMSFPRYDSQNDAYFDDWNADTPKKMDIIFTGKVIEAGFNYYFKLSFPHVRIENPEAGVSGAGKIPMSLKLQVLGAESAPLGMTGITAPFQIDVQNTRSTDPLA